MAATIGALDSNRPVDTESAGGGDEELRGIKEALAGVSSSFPNWTNTGTPQNDILLATAPELDASVALGLTAIQAFGPSGSERSGTDIAGVITITTADNDYTVNQISDAAVPAQYQAPQDDRAFMQYAEKDFLTEIAAHLGGIDAAAVGEIMLNDNEVLDTLTDVDMTTDVPVDGSVMIFSQPSPPTPGVWVPTTTSALQLPPVVGIWRYNSYEAEGGSGNTLGIGVAVDGSSYFPKVDGVKEDTISGSLGTIKNDFNDGIGFRLTINQKSVVTVKYSGIIWRAASEGEDSFSVLEADLITDYQIAYVDVQDFNIGQDTFSNNLFYINMHGNVTLEAGDTLRHNVFPGSGRASQYQQTDINVTVTPVA